eukprot:361082-Chlamydomonas_euryale.AAC.19
MGASLWENARVVDVDDEKVFVLVQQFVALDAVPLVGVQVDVQHLSCSMAVVKPFRQDTSTCAHTYVQSLLTAPQTPPH